MTVSLCFESVINILWTWIVRRLAAILDQVFVLFDGLKVLVVQLVQLGNAQFYFRLCDGAQAGWGVDECKLEVLQADVDVVQFFVDEAQSEMDLVDALEVYVFVQGAKKWANGTEKDLEG